MEKHIVQQFKTVNTRLNVVEAGHKDYKKFKPVILAGLKTLERLDRDHARFKESVFGMMHELGTAIDRLSGIRLNYGDMLSRYQMAYERN